MFFGMVSIVISGFMRLISVFRNLKMYFVV